MYKGYKIVVNTAAGRRRYMQYLIPFVVSNDSVDRYDIWVHTHNGADIEFFKQVAQAFPKVRLVMQPDGIVGGNKTINAFYKSCCEEGTIYFKLDDDICWMEPDAIDKMVKFRIDNPQYFIVSPLVINNPLCSYMMQTAGVLHTSAYQRANPFSDSFWKDGKFAYQLHKWFIDKHIEHMSGGVKNIYINKREWSMNRLSINAILWFGNDMKAISGIVPGDDEEFLSCLYPARIGRSNCVNGDAVVSHFAFFTQREYLDAQHILEHYGNILHDTWKNNAIIQPIHTEIQRIMQNITEHESELMQRPSPYKKPVVSSNSSIRKSLFQLFKAICPPFIAKWYKNSFGRRSDTIAIME